MAMNARSISALAVIAAFGLVAPALVHCELAVDLDRGAVDGAVTDGCPICTDLDDGGEEDGSTGDGSVVDGAVEGSATDGASTDVGSDGPTGDGGGEAAIESGAAG
jgi:hypothetical protein